jgi:CBS domain-containing protein
VSQSILDVMTPEPLVVEGSQSAAEAARMMRDADVGSVIVLHDRAVAGIVTDRDITVRVVAEGRDPETTPLSEICSAQLIALAGTDTVEEAIEVMRTNSVRRLPVLDEEGRPLGIVSLGDLAVELDRGSALGDISAAPPNR